MKYMRKSAVSIIGGADNPTSIILAGKSGKQSLRMRIRNRIYKCRRRRAEKRIAAGSHTLEESAAYAKQHYNAKEVNSWQRRYAEQKKNVKESLILQHKSGSNVSNSQITMDYHIYEIKIGSGCLEMEIDYIWNIFGISCSGNKKEMKQLEKIAQDLYLYYGVSEADIREKTERYSSLLAVLSM